MSEIAHHALAEILVDAPFDVLGQRKGQPAGVGLDRLGHGNAGPNAQTRDRQKRQAMNNIHGCLIRIAAAGGAALDSVLPLRDPKPARQWGGNCRTIPARRL